MKPMSADIPGRINSALGAHAATHAGLLERPAARVALVCGFALLTWVGAKISVPLPLTPVPGTLQTLAVLLAGALLGARAGAASQAAYLLMGIAGLPVFALPGAGPGYLLGPTGGYLVGLPVAAYVTGLLLARVRGRGIALSMFMFVLGAATIHLFGFAWLLVVLGDPAAALRAGVLPFIAFDLAKVVVATGLHTGYLRWKPSTRP
jgi:biotin transport system substrate-specific component